jgi:hypothetical protein
VPQSPRDWIELNHPIRDAVSRREGPAPWSNEDPSPWPLVFLRILGFVALVAFPVVSSIVMAGLNRDANAPAWRWYWLPLLGPGMVLFGFVALGAGFRAAGSIFRGALAGAALYVLLGAAFMAYFLLRFGMPPDLSTTLFLSLGWPVMSLLLLGFLGGFG